MPRRFLVAVFLFMSLTVWGAPPDGYKVETTGACAEKTVAEPVRGALQPQGVRLMDEKGAVAELWLRRVLPTKSGASGASYSALNEGTLVGVLNFPAKGSDFRGQTIKPGFYTLRYVQIPSDGNHMGAAPSSDFLLLIPAAVDTDLDSQPKFDALVALSRKASGTNHPGVLMLTPATSTGALPAVQHQDSLWSLVIKTQTASAKEPNFPIALVLIGKAEG